MSMKKYIQLYSLLRDQISQNTFTPGGQLPTEHAIASKYQVSRQTVRQALDLLRKDGYIFSVQGSGSFISLPENRSPSSQRIAVIMTYFSEYIFPSILRGISEAAVEHGYTIEISATCNSISAERAILSKNLQHPVDGIIVEGTKAALPNPNTSYYQQLANQGVPVVFINSIYPTLECDRIISVVTDDFNGGYQLAKRLIAKGHKSIGCIFKSDDAQGINRFRGAISAFIDSGTEFNDSNFVWFTTETKQLLLPLLIPSGFFLNCSAIICYNDEVAAMVFSYLKQKQHSIAEIASFDHNINNDLIPPGIEFHSLNHPKDRLGKTAALKLFNLLADKQAASEVLSWSGD